MGQVTLEQGSDEWKKWRDSIVGASDAPIILGKSPYKTKRQLWEEKVGLSEGFTNDAMKLGNQLEPMIRQMVNDKLGADFKPLCVQSDEHKWMGASLDGFYQETYLEIKVNNEMNHRLAQKGEIAEYHNIQMQHQGIVINQKRGIYASYNAATESLSIVHYDCSNTLHDTLVSESFKFWEAVRNFDPPELTENDWQEINDPEVFALAKELDEIQKKCKDMENKTKFLKSKMIEMTGAKNNIKIGDYRLVKQERKGTIQYDKIDALKTVDLEQYRKAPSTFWVLK